MGAKNSKVKGGQKEGVAASDESADVADNRTATLPASFKQKVTYSQLKHYSSINRSVNEPTMHPQYFVLYRKLKQEAKRRHFQGTSTGAPASPSPVETGPRRRE